MASGKLIVGQVMRRCERWMAQGFIVWAVLMLAMAEWFIPVVRGQASGVISDRHVVVVSIDGLGATWLTNPPASLRIPHLKRLMEEGSYAEGVVGVYPSVTYPSHTTMVTGRPPAEHGIYSNLSSREWGKNSKDWYWNESLIKVPTLWDVARENKLTTSAVFWPVTTGGPVHWNIPEIWDPQKGTGGDPLYIAQFATPGLLFDAALELGALPSASDDAVKVKLAGFILKKHKPNLLMIHLVALDGAQHRSGPASAEAAAALEGQDARIGELLAAINDADLSATTDLFVVSDHGFFPVERTISPNVLLAKAGLIHVDEKGNITGGRVFAMPDGGSFFVSWPDSQDLRAEVVAALKPLRDSGVLYAELGRPALTELGAEPAAQLALEAPSGAAFDSRATGEVLRKLAQTTGTHGYLPSRREMHASFIARGPHIRQGVVLRQIPMTAVAPTLLKALGIEKGPLGTRAPLDEIFK